VGYKLWEHAALKLEHAASRRSRRRSGRNFPQLILLGAGSLGPGSMTTGRQGSHFEVKVGPPFQKKIPPIDSKVPSTAAQPDGRDEQRAGAGDGAHGIREEDARAG